MGTPARKLILDNLATVLAGITVANGYKTTVVTVERVLKDWGTVGAQQMPWLGFAPGKETFEHQPCGVIKTTLELKLVGHINASTDAARCTALSNLVDDVIAALNVDTTRGDNAVVTTVVDSETDEGDPDTLDSRGGSGSVVLTVRVLYFRTTGAS